MISPKKPLKKRQVIALAVIDSAEKLSYFAPSVLLCGVFMLSMAGFQHMINQQTRIKCQELRGQLSYQPTAVGESLHCIRSLQVKPFVEPLHP